MHSGLGRRDPSQIRHHRRRSFGVMTVRMRRRTDPGRTCFPSEPHGSSAIGLEHELPIDGRQLLVLGAKRRSHRIDITKGSDPRERVDSRGFAQGPGLAPQINGQGDDAARSGRQRPRLAGQGRHRAAAGRPHLIDRDGRRRGIAHAVHKRRALLAGQSGLRLIRRIDHQPGLLARRRGPDSLRAIQRERASPSDSGVRGHPRRDSAKPAGIGFTLAKARLSTAMARASSHVRRRPSGDIP